jgi:hypothetical protein
MEKYMKRSENSKDSIGRNSSDLSSLKSPLGRESSSKDIDYDSSDSGFTYEITRSPSNASY